MHRYLDNTETLEDKTYQKIIGLLNSFIDNLPSEEDKQLLSGMVSKCYRKHNKSIMAMEKDDPSLTMPLIMALLVDQQSMIDRLSNNNNS